MAATLRSSWAAVVWMGAFIALSQTIAVLGLVGRFEVTGARLVHAGLALAVIAVSFVLRRRWSRRLAISLFVLLVAPSYLISWLAHTAAIQANGDWAPFTPYRLFFIVLAVLIPGSYWVNVALMAGFFVEALVLYRVIEASSAHAALMLHEPWTTMIYVVIGMGLLMFRASHDKLVVELERTRSRAEAVEQLARIAVSLRDRANTPIQTVKLAAELLRVREREASKLADMVARAADRLAEMNVLLSRLESDVAWARDELMSDEEILSWLEGRAPPPKT